MEKQVSDLPYYWIVDGRMTVRRMHYLLCLKNIGSHDKGFKVYCLKEKNVTPPQKF